MSYMMNNMKSYKAIPVRHNIAFDPDRQRPLRPWQYLLQEFNRLGIQPPARIPQFDSIESADAWLRHEMAVRSAMPAERRSVSYPAAV